MAITGILCFAWLLPCLNTADPAFAEPAIVDSHSVKVIASFEEGVDQTYDNGAGRWAPHFWTTAAPTYTYAHADVPSGIAWWGKINSAWDPPQTDNVNWWNTLGDKNGGNNGYSDVIYQLHIPGQTNYENWSIYEQLRIKWFAGNPDDTRVNMQVFAYTQATGRWVDLGYRTGTRDTVYTTDLSLNTMTAAEKQKVSHLLFRTFNTWIPAGNDYNHFQRTHLFSIKAVTASPPAKSATLGGYTWDSKFLGTLLHRSYGTYSATGFYDPEIGKYRLWFGSGIPEANGSDNVYYAENDTMQGDWSNPVRTTLEHFGILKPYNQAPGWGGDPSVLKIGSQYVMYFSGIKNEDPYWNRIYRAVSDDGVNWTLSPKTPVVDAATGGAAGYGSGSPSVIYKDGTYYMYYYSQFEQPDRGGTYLRTSTDGIHFSSWTALNADFGGADVKYADSLGKWILIDYRDKNQDFQGEEAGIRYAVSSDGINFTYNHDNSFKLAQDDSAVINHNPGFIGTPTGHANQELYVTYGINQLPLNAVPYEYQTRQLGYSSLRIY